MCAGALWLAAASRWPVRGLPLLFLWAFPKATVGILDRLKKPSGAFGYWPSPGPQPCLAEPVRGGKHFQRHVCRCIVAGHGLSVACPRPASPLLMGFSESNVWHSGPPSNPSQQLAGLPLLFLWAFPKATVGILDRPPTLLGSWQACLFSSYGLPKATLDIVDRPQTLLGSWQACQQR